MWGVGKTDTDTLQTIVWPLRIPCVVLTVQGSLRCARDPDLRTLGRTRFGAIVAVAASGC